MAGNFRNCAASVALVAAAFAAAFAIEAGAAAQRTFVASTGQASNTSFNCSVIHPCRAFSEAIGVTSPGGEVIVLDSAGYGPVVITQGVSIIAPPGVYAGISVFSGVGIMVSAPNAGASTCDTVILQGLSINNQGGSTGIKIDSACRVQIDRCVIAGFAPGIHFDPTAATALRIRDSTVQGNGGGTGLLAAVQVTNPTARSSSVAISRSLFNDNAAGISVVDVARTAIFDTELNRNSTGVAVEPVAAFSDTVVSVGRTAITNGANGVQTVAFGGATVDAVVNISHSVIANNLNVGVLVDTNGIVRMSRSQITGNGIGAAKSAPGSVESLGNNMLTGNGANGSAATAITLY